VHDLAGTPPLLSELTDRTPHLSLVRPPPVVAVLETEAADGTAA
jgi:hypothetical protein